MIISNNFRFYVFGGYGTSWHRLDRTVSYLVHPENFHEDENGQSWNNQLLYFDFSDDHWVKVLDGGDRPTPRAATSSAYISSLNKVGEIFLKTKRMNKIKNPNGLNLFYFRSFYLVVDTT